MLKIASSMPRVPWGSLLVLGLLLGSALVLGAPRAVADQNPDPLRPADTSSPRDTLQSFLADMGMVVEDRRSGTMSAQGRGAFNRAMGTLDFSTTPEGNSWLVRIQRMAMLYEVLSRIALPPADQVLGDAEIADADDAIVRWTIPDTRITLERMAQGPRVGEFRFSADTVGRIDRLYRQSAHLPYRSTGAEGVYDLVVGNSYAQYGRARKLRNRLKPVDTSSPRATLEGFLDSMNRAYALVMDAEAALEAEPPTMTREDAREAERMASYLLRRAIVALDLSQVPKALRDDTGEEAALLLKEVLDRVLLPPIESVPSAQMVAAARAGALGPFVHGTGPLRWRIPNTEIEIVEITEGEHPGQFLFSAATVERIRDDYRDVRDIAYRDAAFAGIDLDYVSPSLSPGFYEYFLSNPGHLVPRAYVLSGLIDRLPAWLKVLQGEQTRWQWIGLLLTVLALALASVLILRLIGRLARRAGAKWGDWLRLLAPIGVAFLVALALHFLNSEINITGGAMEALFLGGRAIILLMLSWVVLGLTKAVAETVIASPRTRVKEDSIDATMWRIGARILGFLLAAWVLVDGMQELGANVVPLLAGLGVGGLAVALAARETLTDVFGSLIILADRPYRIGHWVIIGDKEGTVESIGIRSTRIRTFYDSVLSIPNSEAVSKIIDNMGMRTYRRVYTKIGIRYDTPPERIEAFLEGIKRIIQANPTTRKDYFHVVLNDFGPDNLVVMLYFFVKVPDWSAELVERQRVFIEVIRLAESLGVGFAFPTQTLEIERFPGRADPEPLPAASDEELRAISAGFASPTGTARPRGLGIFVPAHEEGREGL